MNYPSDPDIFRKNQIISQEKFRNSLNQISTKQCLNWITNVHKKDHQINQQFIDKPSFRHTMDLNFINNFNYNRKSNQEKQKISVKVFMQNLEEKLQIYHKYNEQHSNKKIRIPRQSDCSLIFQKQTNSSLEFQKIKRKSIQIKDLKKNNKKIRTYYIQKIIKGNNQCNSLAYQHLKISLKILKSIKNCKEPSESIIIQKMINIQKYQSDYNKKTLILDLDQTLIHCEEQPTKNYQFSIPISIETGQIVTAYISLRPYVLSFLKKMAQKYQIIVFTASDQSYADMILDQIDPDHQTIKHRLYRNHCIQIYPNIYTKDLRVINRQFKNMVLVDNAPYSYLFQLGNGIPITPYYQGQDNELLSLEKYLIGLLDYQDVRQKNIETFKLDKYYEYDNAEELINSLYCK